MAEVVPLRVLPTLRFPLPESARYDYAQRFGAQHKGTDIFAERGTPVLAVASGKAEARTDPKGGKVVYLTAESGTRYYYAHLEDWTGDFPRDVRAGEMLGLVGTTGNAALTPPHLHFQVSPGAGEAPIDPYPMLTAIDPHRSGVSPDHQEVTKPSAQAGAGWGWLLLLLLWSRRG